MPNARMNVLAPLSSPDWNPTSESHGMPWDDAVQLVDDYAVEIAQAERAATYRAAADLIDVDDDCGCGGCDSCIPRKLAARLRAKADEIAPPAAPIEEPTP